MAERNEFNILLAMMRGHQLAAMIHVAARWTLADRIGDGRKLDDVARELTVEPARLHRIVTALSAFNLFAVDGDGFVTNTATSHYLKKGSKPSLFDAARFWGLPDVWSAWGDLEQALRNGKCAFEARFGRSFFSHLERHPEQGEVFQAFMSHSPEGRHAAIARAYDFSRVKRIADIGGGDGMQLAALLALNSASDGILYDRASVVGGVATELVSFVNNGRCEIIAGDFLEVVPPGAEVYLLSQIIHDWDDESAVRILANCRAAMERTSVLLVIERLFEFEPGVTHPNSFLSDMEMLILHGSAERSIDEYRSLLRRGGFNVERVIHTEVPFSIIECAPT